MTSLFYRDTVRRRAPLGAALRRRDLVYAARMRKRDGLHRNLVLAAGASFLVGAGSVHCGSNAQSSDFSGGTGAGSGTSTSNGGASGVSNGGSSGVGFGGSIGFDVQTQDYSAEQIYASDPPLLACDGGGMPPPVGGTPECPSDKNLPGCPCSPAGSMAACWTGLRKDRGQGDCKDGMTVCGQGEQLVWGVCSGEVLPMGTTGKAACQCFSSGHWAIANLSPCFYTNTDGMGNTTMGAISTIPQDGGASMCPAAFDTAPTQDWSSDTLTIDCAGTFNLCYTIKAGNPKMPLATDCTVVQVCAAGYYAMAGVVQPWPDLPGWLSDPSAAACVAQFTSTGGYGQMSVVGQSNECEDVSKVFQTVTYCPLTCNSDPTAPGCVGCQAGGGGTF